MKLFLSCSISRWVDPETMMVADEHRAHIEEILDDLRRHGHEVFADIEVVGWKIVEDKVDDNAAAIIQHIDSADAVIALLEPKPSAGVQWEIGYANGTGKTVYAFVDEPLQYWNQAMIHLGHIIPVSDASALPR